MNFKRYVEASDTWVDSHYIMGTSTDTITTPADIYANDTTATVGLKGNMSQSGTPTPQNPIQPQSCGERTGNLFDKLKSPIQLAYLNANGYWIAASDSKSITFPCEPNTTYTLSTPDTTMFRLAETPLENPTPTNIQASIIVRTSSITEYTFTTAANTKSLIFQGTFADADNWINSLMLNSGSQPLPYEPYGYKIPILNNSQTTNVYLGEVQTTRRIRKLVLTGEETLMSGSVIGQIRTPLTGAIDSLGLCTHYILKTSYGGAFPYIRIRSNTLWFEISPDGYETKEEAVTEFKAYLAQQYAAGTPVTVWYVLATPETGVVNEPLMKIGDYADEVSGITIPTIAGANTLSIGTTLQPSEVTATYKGWHPVADVHERENGAWD